MDAERVAGMLARCEADIRAAVEEMDSKLNGSHEYNVLYHRFLGLMGKADAYREVLGIDEDGRPIEPEPVASEPTKKADPHREASSYIGRLRNAEKRRYARAWYGHVALDMPAPEDGRYGLGEMGKQAVRMHLAGILA